jgi:metallophosphoesterase superfamily enzyme
LTPEGAALHPAERTAVIADVHLGYEWARGAAGDCVPAHSLDETLARLAAVLARASINRLIVAGDLVESARPCRTGSGQVSGFFACGSLPELRPQQFGSGDTMVPSPGSGQVPGY